jgi:hypothetical protein
MNHRRSRLLAVTAAAAFSIGIAGTAFAGEVTGNGDPTGAKLHANSVCVFSGQNDLPDNPLSGTLNPGGESQSYGQLNRLGILQDFLGVTPKDFNPGDACRGGSNDLDRIPPPGQQ